MAVEGCPERAETIRRLLAVVQASAQDVYFSEHSRTRTIR